MPARATSGFIPAIASQSLGKCTHHSIESKLAACSRHGLHGIEIFFEDLESASESLPASHGYHPSGTSFPNSTTHDERLLAAATYINTLCVRFDLTVLCLQPFMHYEGLLDRSAHATRITELKIWMRLADCLQTDLIQIPSSFLPQTHCTSNLDLIVADLREIADLGLQHNPHPIRFAHEALAWGTHANTWDRVWEIVKQVDRPNFGTCIDTFNLAGRVWADPALPSGRNETAEQDMRDSLQNMRTNLDISKVFYVEVVDGERLDQPLDQNHPWYIAGQPARMTWSRNARLLPFEQKGYLPILDIVRVLCDELGYRGYISFELFSRTLAETHEGVPEEHAARAETSWHRLCESMKWVEDGNVGSAQQEAQTHSQGQEQSHLQRERPDKPSDSLAAQSSTTFPSTVSTPTQRHYHTSPLASLWKEESRSATPPVH